jgi:hypothetical protein
MITFKAGCSSACMDCLCFNLFRDKWSHLYIATFQQHLHMKHASLRRCDIPELVVLIMNRSEFLHRELLLTRDLLNKWFLVVEVITSKVLRSPPWLGKPLSNIYITNDCIICFMLRLFYSHYGPVLFHGIASRL